MKASRHTKNKRNKRVRRRTSRYGGEPVDKFMRIKFFKKPRNAKTQTFVVTDINCPELFQGKEVGQFMSNSFDLDGITLKGKIKNDDNASALRSSLFSVEAGNLNDDIVFKLIKGKGWGYYVHIVSIEPGPGSTRASIFDTIKATKKTVMWKDPFSGKPPTLIPIHGTYKAQNNDIFNGYRRNVKNVDGCTVKTTTGGGGGTWNNLGSGLNSSFGTFGAGAQTDLTQNVAQPVMTGINSAGANIASATSRPIIPNVQ